MLAAIFVEDLFETIDMGELFLAFILVFPFQVLKFLEVLLDVLNHLTRMTKPFYLLPYLF